MTKSSLNTKGFGIIGMLLVIVVVVALGGVGAYVYHRDHKTKTSNSSSNKSTTQTSKKVTTPDPYTGWKTYTIASTGLSFKYPADWTVSDTPQSNGTDNYAITAPASELTGLSVSPVGEAITSYEVSVRTGASGSSVQSVPVGAQSQSSAIGSGALKGKYLLVNGDAADGVSELFVLNNNYQPGQKIAENGTVTVAGKQYTVAAVLMAGQDIGDAQTSSLLSSQLYKDTTNILDSLSTN